jgi:PIN domain nuclease of toxin-antitoxin system
MKLLLDTHIYIWLTENNPQLSSMLRMFIEENANEKYISLVSFYEIAIKVKIGKLKMSKSIRACIDELKDCDITLLPISESHISFYDAVPLVENHRDPFDRLIIATAMFENLSIITADKQFDNYTALVRVFH